MRPSRLLLQLVVWALALVALNLVVARASRNAIPRALARKIDAAAGVTDLFVGNSLTQLGMDVAEYEAARPGRRALNIGVPSQPPEHAILFERAAGLRPRRVFYGFSVLQLTSPEQWGTWREFVGPRSLVYYLDRELAIRYLAPADPLLAWQIRILGRVPSFVERGTLWLKVEKLRRRLGAIGLPPEKSGRSGRSRDFEASGFEDDASFLLACREAVARGDGLLPPVADILALAREGGAEVAVVEMPMPGDRRRRLFDNPDWAAYRRLVADLVRRAGATYIDASDWMADDAFEDPVHLNPQGARAFTRRLAATDFAAGDRDGMAAPPGPRP